MSELAKGIAEAEAILVAAKQQQQRTEPSPEVGPTLSKPMLNEKIKKLGCLCQKYATKAGAVDPVSGTPLYGPTMKDRIGRLAGLVASLEDIAEQWVHADIKEGESAVTTARSGEVNSSLDAIMLRQNEERLLKEDAARLALASTAQSRNLNHIRRFRDFVEKKVGIMNRNFYASQLKKENKSRVDVVTAAVDALKVYMCFVCCGPARFI